MYGKEEFINKEEKRGCVEYVLLIAASGLVSAMSSRLKFALLQASFSAHNTMEHSLADLVKSNV